MRVIAALAALLVLGIFASPGPHGVSARGKVFKPRIQKRWIPFGPVRKHQMADYSKRHYGVREWRLKKPRQIVQHVAVAPSVSSVFNTFADRRPDSELGERPNVCAHFAISRRGRIVQMVGLNKRCRHTVGLNHVAIGIEHVGYRDGDLLGNRRQLRSSVRLTRWLRCRFDIHIRDVIGHNESLRSRFHRERVRSLRSQTHGDMRRASMRKYRKRLHAAGRCPR
ncbi:MAG: N-acetylmuramoyl-L-alanine amidase [Actinomycetota bacterium]|nr:N-acetylmuramoyl-L-alanine amidase [Actinomycetota bacterium]